MFLKEKANLKIIKNTKKILTNCPKSIDKPKKNKVYLNGISKFLPYKRINHENFIKKEEELFYFNLRKT